MMSTAGLVAPRRALEKVVQAVKRGSPPSFFMHRLTSTVLAGTVGLCVLVAYAVGFEGGARWVDQRPAMHPYTALCLVVLAVALSPGRPRSQRWRRVRYAALAVVVTLLSLRLAAPTIGPVWRDALTPFRPVADALIAAGKPVDLPANVATALLMLAFAEILRRQRSPTAAQAFACGAVVLLFVGTSGYLANVSPFWGSVGPAQWLAIGALAIALLFATARHGFMRALTARSAPGRLARLLLGSSTALLLLIGWFVARSIDNPGVHLPADPYLLVYESAVIAALIWLVVAVSTVRADRFDRLRAVADRLQIRTSTHDGLTGLLTRNSMARQRAERSIEGQPSASLFIDLDRFRSVNEALGAEQGDRILKEVARRLRALNRGSLVARLGGDEFAMFVVDVTVEQADALGNAATRALAQPFDIDGRLFRLTASVSVAHTESAGTGDLRQSADDAMYVAKSRGGNQCVVFARSMHDARQQEAELEQDLHVALRRDDELSLVYQPVVRVTDHQLVAVEALARWSHPRLGMVAPDRFIHLAERTGLMIPLGRKLMEIAVRQAAAWEAASPGLCPVLNINVSPVQFTNGDVVADMASIARRHGVGPQRLCIEVTESVLASDAAISQLVQARAQGFKVAMDDFGVGYSTLSQLPRLPLTSVKLDRSFIVHATQSAGDAAIFHAITQLVHALGLTAVAEGVEDQAQFDLIAASGCDAAQGYLIARPLKAAAFESWEQARSTPMAAPRPAAPSASAALQSAAAVIAQGA
jgi:diguanylate cyclase (GGDEF)-like protein